MAKKTSKYPLQLDMREQEKYTFVLSSIGYYEFCSDAHKAEQEAIADHGTMFPNGYNNTVKSGWRRKNKN